MVKIVVMLRELAKNNIIAEDVISTSTINNKSSIMDFSEAKLNYSCICSNSQKIKKSRYTTDR